MINESGPTTIIILVVVGVLAHVALLIGSRSVNPLFLIAAAFFLLTPLSVAERFPLIVQAKYGRAYVTVLLPLIAFLLLRIYHLRRTGVMILFFSCVYIVAGLWSPLPTRAILYKGNYGAAVLAGLMLAYSVRDLDDLKIGVRALVTAASIYVAVMVVDIIRNPAAISHLGRLEPWGMNPNRVGQTAATMLTLCAFLALYDSSKSWKIIAYMTGSVLAFLILASGSRGGAGEAALGCFAVSIPLFRRPGALLAVGILVGITVLVVFTRVETEAGSRLISTDFTREGPWGYAIQAFADAPVFGQGWVYTFELRPGGSSLNLHSIYLQVLAEVGLFGLAIVLSALGYIGLQSLRLLAAARAAGVHTGFTWLALALAGSVLAHGVFESAPIMGTSVNVMMLAFGLGLIDRLQEIYSEYSETWDDVDVEQDDEYGRQEPDWEGEGGFTVPMPDER
jgi:O-antigen ligase